MRTQNLGSISKRGMGFSLSSVVVVSSLVGCLGGAPGGGDDDREPTADAVSAVALDPATTSPRLPKCVAPPAFDQTVVQPNQGDVGGEASAQSPDGSYFLAKGAYVTQVTSTINPFASSQLASAFGLQSGQSQSICQNTTTTATFYGFSDVNNCWMKGPTLSKLGVWHPAEGDFLPAVCDDGVGWNFPASISSVRIQAKSVLQTASGSVGQRIEEGTSWNH